MIEIEGQGKTELSRISANRFKAKHVQPETTVEFITDNSGNIQKFLWIQTIPIFEWNRIDTGVSTENKFDSYVGRYKLNGNAYHVISVKNENGHLTAQTTGESKHELTQLSNDSFQFRFNDFSLICQFVRNQSGTVEKILTIRSGPISCIRVAADNSFAKHVFGTKTPFTAADSVRGMLSSTRSCYDVLFYDLDVSIDPETKSLRGNNRIRFKAVQSFDSMQIDLFANMQIEKIIFHDQPLPFTRKFDAVFIKLPKAIHSGETDEINFYYSGKPQLPDPSTMRGGFIWFQDKNGKPWIESVSQGSGASLWWPCKDHLSDEPDSMKISVTIPSGINEISNGKLLRRTDLPNNLTRFEWYMSYPINNYNVAVNIGDYIHFSDSYINKLDTLVINYYCLSYNIDKAKQIFSHVKPMLDLYDRDFGFYPFKKDGFTLMESLYPMEHQGAVSIGPINNPGDDNHYDSSELIRTTWHEAAHEWWGNSVSCKDMADLWIHEAFATYAEVLNYETFYGKERASKYLYSELPKNAEPIIGTYGVNDFHLGDMYGKGALMIHTFRNIIDNDSLFFSALRGIQTDLEYQTVTTEDVISSINKFTNKDFKYFFDQYLRYPAIPELQLRFAKNGSAIEVQYRWNADVKGFSMPVKVTTEKNKLNFIFPTEEWKKISVQNMNQSDFKVDTDEFYASVKIL